MTGDFSVIVDPYLWKRLKNDDDEDNGDLSEVDFNIYSTCIRKLILNELQQELECLSFVRY